MRRILVTGATGTIGAELVRRLVRDGWQVGCLVRGRDGRPPAARLEALFGPLAARLEPLEGDLLQPCLGLDPRWLRGQRGRFAAAVHAAASISFDDRKRQLIWAANRDGTRHFTEAALRLGVPRVHAVSTAYVAGDAPWFAEHDLDVGQQSRNAYEASKKAAEEILWAAFGERLQVLRPSIVVGDSRTGRIEDFEGFYNAARAVQRIVTGLAVQPILPDGIHRRQGRLVVPLTLRAAAAARLNLVPIDWVVETMAALIGAGRTGQCCHLTHATPVGIDVVLAAVAEHFGIAGLAAAGDPPPAGRSPCLGRLQRRLDAALRNYRPYLASDTVFTGDNAARLLGARYAPPPRVDGPMLRRLLAYASDVDWRGAGRGAVVADLAVGA